MDVQYECDADPQRIDGDVVWQFLSQEAYWERWRTRDDVERQLEGAWRVVGCYVQPAGQMVGFARAVSDGVAFAYLADVFVLPEHRGKGLGKQLVTKAVTDAPADRFRWLLHTTNAQGLYVQLGFAPADGRLLERAPVPSDSRTEPVPTV